MNKSLNILGIRGIPAAHGGFETFAANFAPYMRDAGWQVTVYCQADEGVKNPRKWEDDWEGIKRVHFETRSKGALSTIEFDLKCTLDVLKRPGVDLVLGYNTAVFVILQRLMGRRVVMNMDGIEWKRQKWGKGAKAWFWLNEWIGAQVCSTPIADHPEIANHLASRGCNRAVVIPYGGASVDVQPVTAIEKFGLKEKNYFISIARIEPENSILEIVTGFVKSNTDKYLVVLGNLKPDTNAYHQRVIAAANSKVIFPGAIYDRSTVDALRYHCLAYLHGHQVGGTNPSLVEALAAGSPVIAHENHFNQWVAGNSALYFDSEKGVSEAMISLSSNSELQNSLSKNSRVRHLDEFTLDKINKKYHDVLIQS